MTGKLLVIGRGRTQEVDFDTEDPKSVDDTEQVFNSMIADNYGARDNEGNKVETFDQTKPEITMFPRLAGG